MNTYTVFCQDADGTGTTYITSVTAPTIEEAKELAREKCAEDWSCSVSQVRVLGVAEGEVNILEWADFDDEWG